MTRTMTNYKVILRVVKINRLRHTSDQLKHRSITIKKNFGAKFKETVQI